MAMDFRMKFETVRTQIMWTPVRGKTAQSSQEEPRSFALQVDPDEDRGLWMNHWGIQGPGTERHGRLLRDTWMVW